MSVFLQVIRRNLFVGTACPFDFPAHVHEGIEIVYVHHGELNMTVNGVSYCLKPGDILCSFPMVIHSYEGATQEEGAMCVGLRPRLIAEFRNLFLTMFPEDPLIHVTEEDTELKEIIDRMMANAHEPYPLQMTAYVHLFLALILQKLKLRPYDEFMDSGLIQRTLIYMSDHMTEPLTLQSVSYALGISASHLSHIFSRRLNIHFRKFINGMRIEHACTLLRNPRNSIKEIIYACGYENSRTFHRTFLEEVGMTPGEYRKRRHDAPELT